MIDKNKEYKEQALVDGRNSQWLVSSLTEVPAHTKYLKWLRIMGLIETWDMI